MRYVVLAFDEKLLRLIKRFIRFPSDYNLQKLQAYEANARFVGQFVENRCLNCPFSKPIDLGGIQFQGTLHTIYMTTCALGSYKKEQKAELWLKLIEWAQELEHGQTS